MLKIKIPNDNINERKYILDIIFSEFLELEYEVETNIDCKNWHIQLPNNSMFIFEDHFFNAFKSDLEYLKLENIPKQIIFAENEFTPETNIPVIYGTDTLTIKTVRDYKKQIICGIDIFASSFFMLTRWGEYANKKRDIHDRFSATESLAFKHNFLNRPVVNEYVEMLKKMFLYLDETLVFKKRKYELILTHDVDVLYLWKSWKHVTRVALGDIIKRKNIKLAKSRFKEYRQILKKEILDPFDTFDWLMDKSEEMGLKSRFYFMSGGVTKYDNNYDIKEKKASELIDKIQKRGHIIGFHPSFNAYNDFEQFRKEKESLEKVVGERVVEGREHYLRFEVPTTWQIWEDNNMQTDSTCGYADKEGFRCGTGEEYSVFNILTRKKLKLKERALIFMECTVIDEPYMALGYTSKAINLIKGLEKKCLRFNSNFTVLWHNSHFKNVEDKNMFEEILKT